jgi:cell division protein FtsL
MTTRALNSYIPNLDIRVRKGFRPRSRASASQLAAGNKVANFSLIGLLLLIGASSFYIYMINAYASKGYELKKQQAVMKELTNTNKRLMIEQAATASIMKVNDVAATAGMVPVTSEEFLVNPQLSVK